MTSSGSPVHALSPPGREEEVAADKNNLPYLINRIWELLCTKLDYSSITGMQERLLLKLRSSYHVVIQNEGMRTPYQQESTIASINELKSYLGPTRVQRVNSWMKTQMEFRLAYLKMLFQEINISHQNLEAFVAKCEQVEVDADEIANAEQQLQRIQMHIRDFQARMARNLNPLSLNSLFLLHIRPSFNCHVQMSVVTLGPVMFHREKLQLYPYSVYLFWYIASEQPEEPGCMFSVTVKRAGPPEKLHMHMTCSNYKYCVRRLKPDTRYTCTVKRITDLPLVYEPWTDTLCLKTLSSGPHSRARI